MLAALSDPSFPALALLRTRDASDFSIALLDAWAVTAGHPDLLPGAPRQRGLPAHRGRSALGLRARAAGRLRALARRRRLGGAGLHPVQRARIAGQRADPGGHAGAERSRRPARRPQVFETSADLTAVIGWNALPAQTTIPGSWPARTRAPGSPEQPTTSTPATRCCSSAAQAGQPVATGPATFTTSPRSPSTRRPGNTRDLLGQATLGVVPRLRAHGRWRSAFTSSARRPRSSACRRPTRKRCPVPTSSTCPAIRRPLRPGPSGLHLYRRQQPDQSRRRPIPVSRRRQPLRWPAAVDRPDRDRHGYYIVLPDHRGCGNQSGLLHAHRQDHAADAGPRRRSWPATPASR